MLATAAVAILAAACTAWAAPAVTVPPAGPPTPTPYPSLVVAPTPTPESAGVAALLEHAVEATLQQGTATLDMDIVFQGSSLIPAGASMGASGTFAFGRPMRASIVMDMSELGSGVFAIIVDGSTLWLHFEGDLWASLGVGDKWVRIDDDSTGELAQTFRNIMSGPNDALLALYYLLATGDDARVVGEETIGAAAVTRVAATLDLERALDLVPASVRDSLVVNIAEVRAQGLKPVVASEAWVDGSGLVHRIRLVYQLSSMQGGGTMVVMLDLSAHGAPLDLGIPDDAQVIPADQVAFPGG
jgi:hypothetical protein